MKVKRFPTWKGDERYISTLLLAVFLYKVSLWLNKCLGPTLCFVTHKPHTFLTWKNMLLFCPLQISFEQALFNVSELKQYHLIYQNYSSGAWHALSHYTHRRKNHLFYRAWWRRSVKASFAQQQLTVSYSSSGRQAEGFLLDPHFVLTYQIELKMGNWMRQR